METLSASASEKDGVLTLTLANLDLHEAQAVKLSCVGGSCAGRAMVITLRHDDPHACNTFEAPNAVTPTRAEVALTGDDTLDIPAASVVTVLVRRAEA